MRYLPLLALLAIGCGTSDPRAGHLLPGMKALVAVGEVSPVLIAAGQATTADVLFLQPGVSVTIKDDSAGPGKRHYRPVRVLVESGRAAGQTGTIERQYLRPMKLVPAASAKGPSRSER